MRIDLADIFKSGGDVSGMIADMPEAKFYLFCGFLALFATVSFWNALRRFRRARLIEDVPTSKIRSAAQGYVELEGHALPYDSIGMQRSPLGGDDCVWWAYEIEERDQKNWRTVEKKASSTSFVLDDDTGRCLVRPDGAQMSVAIQRQWFGSSAKARPNFGGLMSGMATGGYRYTEKLILAGERVYALGKFETETENCGNERSLMAAPDDGRPFLLATRDQEHLTSGLKSKAAGSFMASVGSGMGILMLLAARGIL